jgi:hypothetical protein
VVKHEWVKPDNADRLQVSVEPLSAAEVISRPTATSGVAVVLHIQPGLPLGPLSQVLRLTFNIPDHDPLEIPLFGTVISDVSLAGPGVNASRLLVNLGTVPSGSPFKRTVFITVKGPYRDQTKLRITGATPDQELQAALGEPLHENSKVDRIPLTIELAPSTRPVARTADENFARIKVDVTHPQVKELDLKVRYIIRE